MARALVLSLHGIRTRGEWQKTLTRELNHAHFEHAPLDYGFFNAARLLWPSSRRRQVLWFLDQYTAIVRENPGCELSIIAHSMGAYLVARSLVEYPEIKFRRVIFCGSIVRRDFPWSEVIKKGQVEAVLNERGRRDIWVALVEWAVQDAGASGRNGFSDTAEGAVRERHHLEFQHSDYFYRLNYRENWIPFLRGGAPSAVPSAQPASPNWRFRVTVSAATILLLALAAGLWWTVRRPIAEAGAVRAGDAAAAPRQRQPAPAARSYQIYVESRIGSIELSHNGRVVATLRADTPFTTLDVDQGEHVLVATGTGGPHRKTILVDGRQERYFWLIE